ncbi:NAD-P-binding protein [Stereum hirsutum FP-91666 SS1]|uniref:NAD-P-binding protein n=1 Tax=Stereum hirsutum (strain FP-91666) TaxID=721885 RepID=UPI000444A111|nr:NAD-P-binding protein [Stereum hirsutum FP-91666 SS1]EIM82907.1 NAD-P-binding protein [Stereum hirsutum FP-91666 SS1]
MSPIRVGLIGLSGAPSDQYQGTGWAAMAHLPYLLDSDAYTLAALCNTSVESAKNALKLHNLPESIKTYGSVEALAADPDIDLIVSCVRVDRHYPTAVPALRAGKSVFVEWPLGANLEEVKEMAAIANEHHARNFVGLQASFSPLVRRVKELVDGGRVGRVLSSSYSSALGNGGATESWTVDYFTKREVGGNPITIGIGHALESIEYILGSIDSFHSVVLNGHPVVDIIARDGSIVEKGRKKTVPDQVMFHAKTSNGAIFSLYSRGGKPFPGTPALEWRIHGETGEIRITSPTTFLNVGHPESKIELHDQKTGQVEVVEPLKDELDHLPLPARNIGRMYELFAKGEEGIQDFEHAAKKHRFLAELFRQYDAQA